MEPVTSEFNPRSYQIDLYEKAVKNNIILFLPTGAGKTYIAIMLLKKLSGDIRKPYSKGGKRSVFVVNTVALVTQQTEYIRRHTDLTCGEYSGDMRVDFWSESKWMDELEKNQVLVMTAQILVDLLTRGFTKLERINLIVFDECHRAVSNHPMRQVMQLFENCSKQQQPRILAMSATLLNANTKSFKIESTIKSLEITLHAKVATIKSTDCIQGYCTNPREDIIKYAAYVAPAVSIKVTQIVDDTLEVLRNVNLNADKLFMESSQQFQPRKKSSKLMSIIKDIQTTALQAGIYGGSKSALLHLIQLECLKKFCDDLQTIIILEYLITQINRIRKLLDDEMKGYTELERVHKFSSDQIHKVFEILQNFNKNKLNDQKFCCIIFVKERFMTQVLYHILKTLSMHEQFNFISSEFIVGYHNSPYKNSREVLYVAKWQKDVLKRFRNGVSNCIVATDVVDEGIDIPTCTLVIRYDLPLDYRGYVQSKGRARHSSSHYKVLVPNDDDAFLQRYKDYKETESILKAILIESDVRTLPTDEDIKDNLYKYEIQPYIVKSNGDSESILTENSVINLINMYCSTLMKSKFVCLVPIWILTKTRKTSDMNTSDILYKVSLKVPNISPLKEVVFGDPMQNIANAKRSAAMKCCINLHELGALTDKLLPVSANAVAEELHYLFPNWIKNDDFSCGTYKKKRQHKIEQPMALYGAFPYHAETLYLHVLHAFPTYSVPHDNRHLIFYNLLNDKSGFGILSTKSMPKIPSFPIFLNVGELNVNVKVNYATMVLNKEDIALLKMCHTMFFNEVMEVLKTFTVFDNDNLDNSFLIVPLNANWEINWNIVKKYRHVEKVLPSTPFHFKDSDYELALVTPSYRASPSIYVVTQVCNDLTPESCFPTEDFDSYTHYYKERHQITIENLQQSLLEVKPISTKINCIKPRRMKLGLSKRKKADVLEDFEEHLVPELCWKIEFPALYWLKTSTLPSILHRITQLLIAEGLRVTIAKEVHLSILTLPSNKKWPPLDKTEGEIEQSTEPLIDLTFDDLMENTLLEPEMSLNELELDVLDTETNSYPWSKDQEPQDLFRNMEQVQIMDIQYYHHFMTTSDEYNTVSKKTNKNIDYISRPNVSVPPLNIFLKKSSYGPSPVEIMQALTTKMSNDMFDLERLETLGDSYLKFITSLFLYQNFPGFNEGQLSALKGKIISNRNLYYNGVKKGIPGRMKVDDFVPMSTFIVPAYSVFRPLQKMLLDKEISPSILYEFLIPDEEKFTGRISESTDNAIQNAMMNWDSAESGSQTGIENYLGVQIVPDKAVADTVEALIGVYLKSTGIIDATKLLQWFEILPNFQVDELLNGSPLNPVIGNGNPNEHMPWADKLEIKLDYKFNNRAYLLQAFTHASYTANTITDCYQRLEFLGDALLDFLITCHIYETCGNLSPGALTDLRSALVNNITFACLAVRYGLHTNLLAYAPKLYEIVDRFVKFQEERNYVINDELLWILLEEEDCNLAEFVDVPKVLGDLFETLIGAIYLDSGKNLKKVWEIIYSLMHKEIDEFSRNIPKQPIRVIYETPDAQPKFLKTIQIESTNTVMVPLIVTIGGKEKLFHGFGANKKLAKCAAAKQALKKLRCQK